MNIKIYDCGKERLGLAFYRILHIMVITPGGLLGTNCAQMGIVIEVLSFEPS